MSGALGSLCDLARAVTDTLNDGLSLMETRLRLMSLELQEEKGRIVGLLVWTALSVLFAMLAIVMVTFTV
ncbi:MAG: phage holin family protein, partial [Desulfovibrionales bacterium]